MSGQEKKKGAQRQDERKASAFGLFLYFFRIGWYTFGGGWSIVAQIQHDYVERRKVMTDEELLDLTSIGRSMPGIMIANIALLFGYRTAGVAGALLSLLGMTLPSVILLSLITVAYASFRENEYVSYAMNGIRACVVPIILCASKKLFLAGLKGPVSYLILAAGFVLFYFLNMNGALMILLAGIVGLVIGRIRTNSKGTDT
ncbi:MAG: chromate transporter [Clostridia bacterium]|nr:chromate transporter [Clostridia bacterium]